MASGVSYRRHPQGTAHVYPLGAAATPSILFGDDNAQGGLNDGIYATSTPTIGLSINGSSVATWSASGMATGAIATTGNISTTGSILSSSATAGIGYATGAGSSVTQGTSKSQATTLNAITGAITMNNAALAAGVLVSFTLTNSAVDLDDVVIVNHSSAGTAGRYLVMANSITAGSFAISVQNIGATSLSEAIVLSYAIIKSVAA